MIQTLKRLAVLAFMILLVGCENPKQERVLVMGVSAEYPPFEYKQNNEIIGFDIDLGHLIAKKLGRTLEIKNMDFSTLIPALQTGRIDIALSGISATPERAEAVEFSESYYKNEFAIISRAQNKIENLEDPRALRIGAQLGSTMEAFARERTANRLNAKIITLSSNLPLIEELKLSRLDAVVMDVTPALSFVKENKGLVYHLASPSGAFYAIALKKESTLTPEINAALQALKVEGELNRLRKKWLKD